jgi:hypothetical protein
MNAFLGLLLGQLLAIGFQWARWVDDTRGWGDYFRHRKKQGQHAADLILSVVIWFAWGTGLLAAFKNHFPDQVKGWIDSLPATNVEPLVGLVIGFALAFVTRLVFLKYFDKPEPPFIGTPEPPKGD